MRREARTGGFVRTGTDATAISLLPAWMSVSSVYVILEKTLSRRAASRVSARKPDVASGTSVPETRRTTHEPKRCARRLPGEKSAFVATPRSPTTISASPARRGATRASMSAAAYWRSASVETMTSAPRRSAASSPARQANARPRGMGSRTAWGARGVGVVVTRAVVHDERLDRLEPWHAAGQLRERGPDLFRLVPGGNLDDELHGSGEPNRSVPFEGGGPMTKTARPLFAALFIAAASIRAQDGPPKETRAFRETDLVELMTLDPTMRLDVRYAGKNNEFGRPFYSEARAFLQRPAAEALVRVNRALKAKGYGLLVFDGYRPWSVTKQFWDLTPADKKVFVANPKNGSL